ncbi:MAG TPA: hypothetical protein VH188_05625 [Chthoniobacterales bacterium]|jgi:hypothetical protein|nr:hypothetical protein [Chthoniobacterales bacterium]
MKFSWRSFGLTFLVGVCFADPIGSFAEIPPLPLPSPGVRPPLNYAIATIIFPGAQSATARAADGRFEMVGIRIHETAEIAVQFPSNPTTKALSVQALDGGLITGGTKGKGIGADAIHSFQFHAPGKPGLYRILVSSSAGPLTLQFWITDPGHPGNKRPIVNPNH